MKKLLLKFILICFSSFFFLSAHAKDEDAIIRNFWNWFKENQSVYYFDNSDLSQTQLKNKIYSFYKQLKKINSKITFEFGPIHNGKKQLIITAEGQAANFPLVFRIVNQSPHLKNWQVIALRPAVKDFESLTLPLDGKYVNINDFSYVSIINDDKKKVNIMLIRNDDKQWDNTAKQVVFILLDRALGEYNTETKLDAVSFGERKKLKPEIKFLPLSTLPKLIKNQLIE